MAELNSPEELLRRIIAGSLEAHIRPLLPASLGRYLLSFFARVEGNAEADVLATEDNSAGLAALLARRMPVEPSLADLLNTLPPEASLFLFPGTCYIRRRWLDETSETGVIREAGESDAALVQRALEMAMGVRS